jgi:hypothetical protein
LNRDGDPVDDGAVMRRRSFLLRTLSGVAAAAAVTALPACQKEPTAGSAGGAGGGGGASGGDEGPRGLALEIEPITPLLPRLATHVAVDSHGNLFWVQESEPQPAGGDAVFLMGEGGVPQTIAALCVPSLLDVVASGIGGRRSGATGAIKSIAVGADDDLYVLFAGGRGRAPIWAVVRYSPKSNQVMLVADTKRLMTESRMDASIELARGSLLGYKRELWLWLRHQDGAAVLRIGSGTDRSGAADVRRVTLRPPWKVGAPTSDQEDMAAGPDATLYYVDRPRAVLWRIAAGGEGDYTAVQSLDGLSRALTAPALDDSGRVCLLLGQDSPLVARQYSSAAAAPGDASSPGQGPKWAELAYPAFVQLRPASAASRAIMTVSRDDLHAPPALPVQDLQPRQLLLDRASGTLITFDAASGEILRVKVVRKN